MLRPRKANQLRGAAGAIYNRSGSRAHSVFMSTEPSDKCPECGARVAENAASCPACGRDLVSGPSGAKPLDETVDRPFHPAELEENDGRFHQRKMDC